jgi:hypothetical protein
LRRSLAALAAALALGLAGPAFAVSVFTVTITSPNIGTFISGATGDSAFHLDSNTGAITQTSGTAIRSGAGTGRATVSIKCTGGGGDCNKNINVEIGPTGSTGRASPIGFMILTMGTATLKGTPNFNGGSPRFTIGPIPSGQTKTFFIGGDLTIAGDDSGKPTGAAASNFFVELAEAPADATTGAPQGAAFTMTIIRGLTVSKATDLVFGTLGKPASGSGTVSIDAASGARTVSTGIDAVPTPPPSRALFNVTGEGGQLISVSVPASFSLTGPSTITVTTTNSAPASPVLSGALGSAGAFSFGVGGSAPIDASTPEGSYSGNFTVTVAYN